MTDPTTPTPYTPSHEGMCPNGPHLVCRDFNAMPQRMWRTDRQSWHCEGCGERMVRTIAAGRWTAWHPAPDVADRTDTIANTRHGWSDRLTTWQAVRQSWLIHPDWTVETHLAWLDQEGYDTSVLYGGTPQDVLTRWLDEHRRTARPEITPLPNSVATKRGEAPS